MLHASGDARASPTARSPARRAIVRPPATTFAQGLTTATLGPPQLDRALEQHTRYCLVLESAGLEVIRLPPDPGHPDSTFVEDTAVLAPGCAIVTRPGAPSRRGETTTIETELLRHVDVVCRIDSPGTVDGGDVCCAGDNAFIGLSARTDEMGAAQLARLLRAAGHRTTIVDLRHTRLLHLKSGMAYLGDGRLVVTNALFDHPALARWDRLRVPAGEEHAANCLALNDHVVVAAPCPVLARRLSSLGYAVRSLDVSEFRKMDGGLSCLSLRF